jgi:hypothetical protein
MAPAAETRTTDSQGRVTLPAGFANTTVVVEVLGDAEVRIRKAGATAGEDVVFEEEVPRTPLSDRDRDLIISLLENPPEPTQALRDAFAEYKKRHG